jgi:hypothetical protein
MRVPLPPSPASGPAPAPGSPAALPGRPGGRGRLWPWAAFAAYLAFHFAFLYHPGLVRYDDFAYLQGVIATFAAGRPVTHDWLEPYSATLSGLCALAYRLTGDFPLSTWGLEAAFAAANFPLLYRLLRLRLGPRGAACLALALATQPLYWYKCAEFTSNPFTYTFVLIALLAWARGRPSLFYAAAFLAAANRQNQAALLILPALFWARARGPALLRPRGSSRERTAGGRALARPRASSRERSAGRGRWGHAIGIAAFLAGLALVHAALNRTLAQSVGAYAPLDAVRARRILQALAVASALVPAFLSAFGLLLGGDPGANLKANLRAPAKAAFATAFFLLIPAWGALPLVDFQTPLIGSADRGHALQLALLVLVPAAYWMLDWDRLRPRPALALCAAYAAIGSLKGLLFDAYLVDIALAALFYRLTEPLPGTLPAKGGTSPARRTADARMAARSEGRAALVLVLAAAHLAWGYAFGILLDKEALADRDYERLERAGALGPADMTDAPFGYLGWKWFDAFVAEGRPGGLSGFLGYVRRDRTRLQAELPWRHGFKEELPAGARILDSGRAPIGGFRLRYRMAMLAPAADRSLAGDLLEPDPSGPKPPPFPLDRGEWTAYILSSRARGETGGAKAPNPGP